MEGHIIIKDSFNGIQGDFKINLDDPVSNEVIRIIQQNNLVLQSGDIIEIIDID